MGYNLGVSQAGGSNGLSPGAVVEIAVGIVMLVLLGALVAFALVNHKKKKRETQSFIGPTVAPGGGGMAYQSGYHAPPGSPPPASTASPAGSPGAKYAGIVSSQYAPSAVTAAASGGHRYSDYGKPENEGAGGWQEQRTIYPSQPAYGHGWQQHPVYDGHTHQWEWQREQHQQQGHTYEPYRRYQLE